MSKNKIRFNILDALILLAIIAAVSVLLYVFVFSGRSSGYLGQSDSYTLTYVVEVANLDEVFTDKIAPGDTVIDSASKRYIGTVTAVEERPYTHMSVNKTEGALVLNQVDGRINLYITVKADAQFSGITYNIGGYEVFVGSQTHLSFDDFVCSGYCISLDAVLQ